MDFYGGLVRKNLTFLLIRDEICDVICLHFAYLTISAKQKITLFIAAPFANDEKNGLPLGRNT